MPKFESSQAQRSIEVRILAQAKGHRRLKPNAREATLTSYALATLPSSASQEVPGGTIAKQVDECAKYTHVTAL